MTGSSATPIISPLAPPTNGDPVKPDIRMAVQAAVAAESADVKLWGVVPNYFRHSLGPMFLIITPPYFVVLFWHVLCNLDGSFLALGDKIVEHGFHYLVDIVPSPVDWNAWKYILSFG